MSLDTQKNFLIAALVGGVIGASAILLLTPYSGRELRQQVKTGISRFNREKRKKHPHSVVVHHATHRAPKKSTTRAKKTSKKH